MIQILSLLATLKAIDIVLKQNMFPKVLQLPQNHDPASLSQIEHMKRYVNFKDNTIDFIEFKYKNQNASDTVGLIQITKDICHQLH